MQSYSSRDLENEGWLARVLGRTRVPKMSVIGPANLLKTIHKNGNIIQAMILTGESISRKLHTETVPGDVKPEGELTQESGPGVTEVSGELAPAEQPQEPLTVAGST